MTRRAGHNESPTEPVTAVKPRDWRGVIIGCIIICVLGVAVRLPVLGRGGVGGDLEFFAGWSNAIKEHGLANVYSESKITANYPIGFMYLLSVFNRCVSPAGEWNKKNVEHPFKVFLCIGDVAITICLVLGGYKLGASGRNALFGGACYMLNPAIIMITALWGQTNAIAVGIMIAALIFLCSRYWPVAYVLAAFACNTKLQVVPFLPLLPLATIFLYPFHNWKGRLKAVTLGAILFLLTTILLFSPFIFKGTVGKAITVGYRSHFKTDTALSANAWNPWGICMPAEQDISSNPPPLVQLGRRVPLIAPIVGFLTYWHISIFLFGAATAAAYFCFVMRPSKQNLFFSASVVAVAFFFLMCKIHERYLLDAIPLLLLAAIFRPRAFGLCGIVSIISVLNMGWCLIIFGLGPALNLLAPVCVVILGLVLVRMLLVVIAPQAEIKWLWEIGFRRKRWFDLPAIAYIAAGGFWLAFPLVLPVSLIHLLYNLLFRLRH